MIVDGLEANKKEGIEYFEKACEGGFPRGCANAGYLTLESGNSKLYSKGLALLAQACEQNEPESCAHLGMAYLEGRYGLEKDPKKAPPLLRRACDLGSISGCINASVMYKNGDSVPKNEKLAEKYAILAKRLKDPQGSFKKGVQLGRGSEQ